MTLVLGTSSFTIRAQALRPNSDLFMYHPDLQTYRVQAHVSPDTFRAFLHSIEEGSDLCLTPENVSEFSLLGDEFGMDRLKRACDHFVHVPVPVGSAIDFRLETGEIKLEETRSAVVSSVAELTERIDVLNSDSGCLKGELQQLQTSMDDVQGREQELKSRTEKDIDAIRVSIGRLTTTVETHYLKGLKSVQYPMKEAKSRDGIIAYLTKKHGGNVHENGIVTITSSSVIDDSDMAPKNVADLMVRSYFHSKFEPDQWIRWDFREIRVRPTHDTIRASYLKSWIVEGSLDGESWTEIDRQGQYRDDRTASFAISNPMNGRFIRLTQASQEGITSDYVALCAVEFFGALLK
jgi:hypothetical protein